MEPGTGVLSVEFKVNLLAPARAKRFQAIGRVVRAGRTVTVTSAELRAGDDGDTAGELVAIMTGTMMTVRDRPGLSD
jgi:acyl-coenzyme A thioesterase PaaI-like protein